MYCFLRRMASSHTLWVLRIISPSTLSSIYIYDYIYASQLPFASSDNLFWVLMHRSYSRSMCAPGGRSSPVSGNMESVSMRNWVRTPQLRRMNYCLPCSKGDWGTRSEGEVQIASSKAWKGFFPHHLGFAVVYIAARATFFSVGDDTCCRRVLHRRTCWKCRFRRTHDIANCNAIDTAWAGPPPFLFHHKLHAFEDRLSMHRPSWPFWRLLQI